MAKKGKKGKGKGDKKGPELITTRAILRERERCMCPRLGDAYTRASKADEIRTDVVFFKIRRAVLNDSEKLDISRSQLGFIPDELREYPELSRLTSLNLCRNQLFNSEHVFGILSTLDSLKTLNLSDNFLNGPLSEQATKLVNLEELLLDVNQISALPKSLGAWSKLRVFSAAENEITELPADAGEWRESVFINLRNNKLKELPNEVGQWVKLERLYLGCNQLQGIPQEFGSLTSLVELELRNNQIAELPMTLSACARLQKLHLGNNKIVEVPSEILSALLEVEELHLYKNKLESLPPELGCLTKCHTMSFSTNNLRTLPDEIGNCESLAELYLSKNAKFSSFPAQAGQLKALKELQARQCPALKSLPNSASDWVSLQELDLRAAKKQVCKLAPELVTTLENNNCKIRGGIQKKAKGKGKKAK